MHPQVTQAYQRAAAASEAIFAVDGNLAAHDERLQALEKVYFTMEGLDLGQVSRPTEHGVPNHRLPANSNPGRDISLFSDETISFLRALKLA